MPHTCYKVDKVLEIQHDIWALGDAASHVGLVVDDLTAASWVPEGWIWDCTARKGSTSNGCRGVNFIPFKSPHKGSAKHSEPNIALFWGSIRMAGKGSEVGCVLSQMVAQL